MSFKGFSTNSSLLKNSKSSKKLLQDNQSEILVRKRDKYDSYRELKLVISSLVQHFKLEVSILMSNTIASPV